MRIDDPIKGNSLAEFQSQPNGEEIMKRATKIVIALGTALTLGLGAAAVSGHPFDGDGPGWGMGPGMMGGYGQGYGFGPGMMGGYGPGYGGGRMGGYGPGYGMGPQAFFGACAVDADEGLAGLKTELGITSKQESAWQAFVKNATQQNENRKASFDKMQKAKSAGSAPEVLAQQAEIMKQRQAEMEANAAALKNLYATLTPEQKVIADQRFGGFGPGWHRGGRSGPQGGAR
jgi:Spy/CpxP family protein refolding chaperone